MIRKSALAASIAALLTPTVAGALGLGNIEVTSALNEPLQARIPLRGADPGQLEELRVALADDQQFERAGLDRVFLLTKLKFTVVETGGAGGYISISTRDPVAEPFLNFLVDVNWPRGRVLREYTVLLDPPVYGAAISTGTNRKVKTVDAPLPVARPAPAPAPSRAAPTSPSAPGYGAPSRGAPRYTGDSYGPVRRGETLWAIADRARPEGTSIQSMMLALLRANPEAFSLDNVNALRTGAVLRIPSASEITGGKAAALEEVARQHALWAEYRQSTGASVSPQPAGAAPSAPPTGTAAAAASTATAAASGTGTSSELKLVGAGTSGAATGGGADVEALRNELTMAQEEADAAKLENQELQSRLTEVESLVGDLQRLVELKEDQLAALQEQLAKANEQAAQQPPAAAPAPESRVAEATAPDTGSVDATKATEPPQPAAAAPKAAEPPAAAKKKRVPPTPPPPPKSLMDEIQGYLPVPLWTLLAGLGALLVGFGAWRFAAGRKAKAAAATASVPAVADTSASMIEQYASTELPETETDDVVTEQPTSPPSDDDTMASTMIEDRDEDSSEMVSTATSTAAGPPPDEDPLAEVNVYLAYERFDQAEQLVRDAIATYPQRHDYKLKLLEVFYAAKNLAAFEIAAGTLRDAVGDDHEMMQQARDWWADLGAGRELFADGAGASTQQGDEAAADDGDELFDVTAAGEGEETGVDFDLSFDEESARTVTDASGVDFDLGADDDEPSSGGDSSLDFDLGSLGGAAAAAGGAAAAAGVAAASSSSEIDFDLGGDDGASADAEQVTGVDFDLDAGPEIADSDTGLDFDLTDDGDAAVSSDDVTARAPLPERAIAAGGDTGLDFDLGAGDTAATRVEGLGDEDVGGSSLDFDLGDTGGTLDGEAPGDAGTLHDEAGGGSGLDFDLEDTQTVDSTAAAGSATDADSVLDFDLGDTGSIQDAESEPESVLDFDLGDTGSIQDAKSEPESVLDFDLGDTGAGTPADDAPDDLAATGEGSSLDFDLNDTVESVGAVGVKAADDGSGTDAGELDVDLTDTLQSTMSPASGLGGEAGGSTDGADLDFDLSDTLGTGAGSGDEELKLDFDLGDTASGTGSAAGEGAGELDLDLGMGDGGSDLDLTLDDAGGTSDLDLTLEADDGAGTGGSLPDLDLEPGGEHSGPAFDTVKLAPDETPSIDEDGETAQESGTGSDFGVDTEFRGIFSGDEAGEGTGTGSESVLDFGLGSADPGASADEGEGTGVSDVESTQFMLQDVPADEGDEDDHTLALGRGGAGEVDEIQTKLDLAQAYMDMGDTEGARNLLGEVMAEGEEPQKEQAGEMLKKLS